MNLLELSVSLVAKGFTATEKRLESVERKAESANRSIEKLRASAAKGVEFRAKAEETGFASLIRKFAQVRANAAKGAEFSVSADAKGFAQTDAAIARTSGAMNRLDGQRASLKTSLSGGDQVRAGLDAISVRADRLDSGSVSLSVSLRNGRQVISELQGVEGVATKVDGDRVVVSAQVNGTEQGRASLQGLQSAANSVDGDDIRMSASVAGTSSAIAELGALNTAAGQVDGRNVRLNVDSGAVGILGRIGESIQETAQRIRNFSTVSSTVAFPGLLAALGAIPSLATAAGAAIGGLASALGQALAGAAGIAGSALSGIGAGFGLLLAAAQPTISAFSNMETATNKVASAQKSAQSAADSLADAERGLAEANRGVQQAQQARAEGVASAQQQYRDSLQAVDDAERGVEDSRRELDQATDDLRQAQLDLNQALSDEPLNQREATLDLADARDAASDALREYNEAVREHGANSEEATDAQRRLARANLALEQTERDVNRTRRNGSQDLQAAREGVESASQAERAARRGVADAERNLKNARADSARAYRGIAAAQREGDAQVAAALRRVEDAQRQVARATRENKSAQSELGKALSATGARLTATQQKLLSAAKRFGATFGQAFRPANDAINMLGVRVLGVAQRTLPALGRTALATVRGVNSAFSTLLSQWTAPRQLSLFQQGLRAIPGFTRLGVQSAGQLGTALANIFIAAIPQARGFLQSLDNVTRRFNAWTRSVEGQRALQEFFQRSARYAKILGAAFVDLLIGVKQLFGALDQSGTTNMMLQGFRNLTAEFRRFTAVGSEGRGKIIAFFKGAQPTMRAMWGLVKSLVGEFFRVAHAINTMRDANGKLVMPQVLNDMKPALRAIGDLLIAAFRNFGPMIAPAIKAIAEFLTIFVANNPVLKAFGRFLIGLVQGFNDLDNRFGPAGAALQSIIVGFISFGIALRAVGLGFRLLFSPFGKITRWLGITGKSADEAGKKTGFLRKAFDWIKNAASKLVDAIAKRGGLVGIIRSIGLAILRVAPFLAFFATPVGIVVAAIAALGIAFVVAYRRSETFRNIVNGVATAVKNIAVGAFRAVKNGVQAAWNWIATNTPRVWNGLKNAVVGAARGVANGARAAWNFLKRVTVVAFAATVAAARSAWNGLKNVVIAVARAIAGGARAAWNGLKNATVAAFRGIVAAVRATWNGLKAVVIAVARGIAAGARGAWNLLRSVTVAAFRLAVNGVKAVWNTLRAVVLGVAKAVANGVRAAWNGLRAATQAVFRVIASIARSVWNGIKTAILAAVRTIGAGLRAAWNGIKRAAQVVWNALRAFFTAWWNAQKKIWGAALKFLASLLTRTWKSLERGTKAVWNAIKAFFSAWWNALKRLWDTSLTAIGNRTEKWRNAFRSLIDAIAKWVRKRWDDFWRGLKALWDRSWRAIGNRTEAWRDAFRNLVDSIAKWVRGRWDDFWGGMKGLWDRSLTAIGDRLRSWRDATKRLFGDMVKAAKTFGDNLRDALVSRISGAVNKVREWLGGLAIALANVLKALGADEMAGNLRSRGETLQEPLKFAKGGTTEYAKGGVTQYAKGGLGTSAKSPRMHLWNEQYGNEAYIVERRPTKEQLPNLRTAASWHGMDVVPRAEGGVSHAGGSESHRRHRHREDDRISPDAPPRKLPKRDQHGPRDVPRMGFARGGAGTLLPLVKFAYGLRGWDGGAARMVKAVEGKFGAAAPASTYTNHAGGGQRGAADFLVSGRYGRAATGSQITTGNRVADFISDNWAKFAMHQIIWNNRIATSPGAWRPWGPRPTVQGRHEDHVHGGAHTSGGASYTGTAPGGGGFFSGVMDALGNAYNSVKDFLAEKFKPPEIPSLNLGPFGDGLTTGLRKSVLEKAREWITEKAESLLSFGSGSGSVGNFPASGEQREVARWMAEGAQGRGMPGELPVMTAIVETGLRNLSGGDRDSLGYFQQRPSMGWGTREQIMDPGYALGKFLDAAAPYKGQYPYSATGLGNWAQAVQRSAFPGKYAQQFGAAQGLIGKELSGYPSKDKPQSGGGGKITEGALRGYQRGGVVPGPTNRPMPAVLHGGERVLPAALARPFELLARALQAWASKAKGLLPDSLMRALTTSAQARLRQAPRPARQRPSGTPGRKSVSQRVSAWNDLPDEERFSRGVPEGLERDARAAGYSLAEDLTFVKSGFYGGAQRVTRVQSRTSTLPVNSAQIARNVQVAVSANNERLEKRVGQMEKTLNDTLTRQLDKMMTAETLSRAQIQAVKRAISSGAADSELDHVLSGIFD